MTDKIIYLNVEDKSEISKIVEQANKLKDDNVPSIIFIKTKLNDDELLELENTNIPILMLKDGVSYDVFDEVEKYLEMILKGDSFINLDINDIEKMLKDTKYLGLIMYEVSTNDTDFKEKLEKISQKSKENFTKILIFHEVSEDVELETAENLSRALVGEKDTENIFLGVRLVEELGKIRGFAITN